jgi:hypothetical protein
MEIVKGEKEKSLKMLRNGESKAEGKISAARMCILEF